MLSKTGDPYSRSVQQSWLLQERKTKGYFTEKGAIGYGRIQRPEIVVWFETEGIPLLPYIRDTDPILTKALISWSMDTFFSLSDAQQADASSTQPPFKKGNDLSFSSPSFVSSLESLPLSPKTSALIAKMDAATRKIMRRNIPIVMMIKEMFDEKPVWTIDDVRHHVLSTIRNLEQNRDEEDSEAKGASERKSENQMNKTDSENKEGSISESEDLKKNYGLQNLKKLIEDDEEGTFELIPQKRKKRSRNEMITNQELKGIDILISHLEELPMQGWRRLTRCVAYYFRTGPWAKEWIRIGHDPRKHPEDRIYQILDSRIRLPRTRRRESYQAGERGQTYLAQLCTINDPSLLAIVHYSPFADTCTLGSGWFPEKYIKYLRLTFQQMIKKRNNLSFTAKSQHVPQLPISTEPQSVVPEPDILIAGLELSVKHGIELNLPDSVKQIPLPSPPDEVESTTHSKQLEHDSSPQVISDKESDQAQEKKDDESSQPTSEPDGDLPLSPLIHGTSLEAASFIPPYFDVHRQFSVKRSFSSSQSSMSPSSTAPEQQQDLTSSILSSLHQTKIQSSDLPEEGKNGDSLGEDDSDEEESEEDDDDEEREDDKSGRNVPGTLGNPIIWPFLEDDEEEDLNDMEF
eukprot:MONOS_9084.1-p1 / transcript=MONOS_9084.1 / gene=MONOS_9084 / organism=Monocercomonoides_exilis_PA203 / gene_product=unspecified product / transcript_product=unspecified product / location=Mono_scaffold00363:46844-49360(-) / protein_length=631 / sequence_SO=supercontig / SO=protein_coding / is_pseudo=false